jgi:hypothetical protein
MSESDLAKLDRNALIALILKLQAEVERLTRSGKRQAAPFSKGTRVERPKRPGRKPGQGAFKRREAPPPETLSEPPIDVPVAEPDCPKCGGELAEDRVEDVSITDLPEVVRPRVRLFRVASRRCRRCRRIVRGRHPDLAADQCGATAHRLGPRLLAAVHHLHYKLGVPVRKLPELIELLTGVRLTQGALTLAALRQAKAAIGATYQNLCDSVRDAPYVHTDDTGWRIGGASAWLMVFETDAATVYQIRKRHRNEEVRERIPADYQGVMITDRAGVYDADVFAAVRKQKCISHVPRSLSEVVDKKTGPARRFATKLKSLMKRALALWRELRFGPVANFAERARRLKMEIGWHLGDRRFRDPDNQRLLNELGRCHDAGSLVRFLDEPEIEPTNNRAERALRPAVIARKVSQCTKNARGTRAFEAWTSVLRTLSRTHRGPELLDAVAQLLRLHPAAPHPA